MDMHEHRPADKKRVFVDSRVLLLRDTWQVDNAFSQFLVKLFLSFHACKEGRPEGAGQYHVGCIMIPHRYQPLWSCVIYGTLWL